MRSIGTDAIISALLGCEHEKNRYSPNASASLRPHHDRGYAGLASRLHGLNGGRGSCPRSKQTSHPVHPHRMAVARWFRAEWRVCDRANLGRFSLVCTGRYDDLRWRSVRSLGWASQLWVDQQERQCLWPNSECLCRPRGGAVGIWLTWDRSPEGPGCHFSVRVGWAPRSSKHE